MREKRREATIERIVETALRLLESEGFEALTIQRLAKELDYAVGALYRYFRSKDALLVALLHRVMDRIGEDMAVGLEWVDNERAEQLAAAGESTDKPLSESEGLLRLIVVSNVYVGFAQRRPAEYGLVSTLIGDPREFLATEAAAPIFPALVRLQLMLTAVIDDAVQAGALVPGDARERGVILWSAMQGVLQLRKLGRFGVAGVELDRLVPIALRTLLLGWGADARRVDELTPRGVEIASALARQRSERLEHERAGQDTHETRDPNPAAQDTQDTQDTEVEDDRT
ncbi:HTH-type transcriptional repressor KstR [Enhygromyxa salina]|uniref:HTH-type transcriptional repressor KstR n=1 Tax=Enhygromyxa salina TaxID=215803 RepID=A0A2S9XDP1_9BACT|nr:TetR family transcriptional regulator [Enhygromyxa salina]PRP90979.1 HTH-type transcriptional repressor KstR [Enhygromyxa salina]